MKTAMQELIEHLEANDRKFTYTYKKAIELLEKEKEQIVNACNANLKGLPTNGKDYYDLNFNHKSKMNTPLQNLKYYFRNDETITKEELLIAIDELIDNERAFFINAFEHGYASSGLVAIEQNKAFEAYGKLYNACNP
jgi:hypothetical protein